MKRKLLEILYCPACRGALALEASRVEGAEIMEGSLACAACRRDFLISNGVPRMILDLAPVQKTKYSFQQQWLKRLAGNAERRTMVFAQDVLTTVLWIHECAQGALSASGWCADSHLK